MLTPGMVGRTWLSVSIVRGALVAQLVVQAGAGWELLLIRRFALGIA